jgi:ubiquinone biosynthesis protein UbiJ
MIDMVRVLEGEIRDLERIIAADEAILEIEKSQAKRHILADEISKVRDKIERLIARIEGLRAVD